MTWHKLLESVGQCLISRRKVLNLSLDCLALEAFVDKAHLRKIEQGQANSSLRIMGKLVKVLQISLYELYLQAESALFK